METEQGQKIGGYRKQEGGICILKVDMFYVQGWRQVS